MKFPILKDYIIDRFKVGSARIEIKYEDIDIEPTIEKRLEKLVGYMSKKEPMTRAILTNSTVKSRGQYYFCWIKN